MQHHEPMVEPNVITVQIGSDVIHLPASQVREIVSIVPEENQICLRGQHIAISTWRNAASGANVFAVLQLQLELIALPIDGILAASLESVVAPAHPNPSDPRIPLLQVIDDEQIAA